MSYNNNNTTQRLDVLDPGTPATQWAQNTESLLGGASHSSSSLPTTASANTGYDNSSTDTTALANAAGYRSVGQPVGQSIDQAAERISHRGGDDVVGDAGSGRAAVGVPAARSSEMKTSSETGAMAGGANYLSGPAYDDTQGGYGGNTRSGFSGNNASTGNTGFSNTGGIPGSYNTTAGELGNGQFGPNAPATAGTERGGTYGGAAGTGAAVGMAAGAAAGGQDRFGAGSNPFRDSTRQEGYASGTGSGVNNMGTSDMTATSGRANGDTEGWTAGAGAGPTNLDASSTASTAGSNWSSTSTNSNIGTGTNSGTGATTLAPSQVNTADLIGPEPKWKNASEATANASQGDSLPPAGIDTQTSTGAISSSPSARTRAALSADPGNTTTHSVLGGQPKQSQPGEPIVDPLSTGSNADGQAQRGFGGAQGLGTQSGVGQGQGGLQSGSSDLAQPTGAGLASGGAAAGARGGVSAEPSARTQAALGGRAY
ncbi:hypothetical protein CALCODRAFT_497833 [Calocera cornea HHB12733]|uniref:Uncharacterized protein n=1 Tax=Calocera cornea HHB12733 TaxID=1353952 RepID=A0A165F2B3_9BASI|nr:hypothetical protein CALCODRAFT_497833 [Calocera cornea HHB12733]